MLLYKITNLVNGKVYIGQTIRTLKKRFKQHCEPGSAKTSAIGRAIQKYGKNNFSIEQITTDKPIVTQEELNAAERYFVWFYNSMVPNGYNLKEGGGSSGRPSHESRLKMSLARKGRFSGNKSPTWGKRFSLSYRKQLSEAHLGIGHSEATRKKMSQSRMGIPRSEAHKINNREAHRKYMRPVMCIETGQCFESIHQAARAFGVGANGISSVVNGTHKSAYGFHWRFV
jgi:group I intron endonuclease